MKNIDQLEYPIVPVYEFDISSCPITGKNRKIEAPELSINSWSIFLSCTIFYCDEDGNKITGVERLKPYQFRLKADNNAEGPWVDATTGERVEVTTETIEVEQGEEVIEKVIRVVPDNAITRYEFLLTILKSRQPIDITGLVEAFVANADDAPYKEFDI